MSKRQNKWFLVSVMLAAGASYVGCDDGKDTTSSGGQTVVECTKGEDNCKCDDKTGRCTLDQDTAASVCYNSSKCGSAPECNTDRGFQVCECAKALSKGAVGLCHSDSRCKGVSDSATGEQCNYTCGEGDSCSWIVCKSSDACVSSGCSEALAIASPEEDFDHDGILNGDETANGLDPCSADTDGDGTPDGVEDLNRNGKYEPEYGETNPKDASSKPDKNASATVQKACDASVLLNGKETSANKITVAQFYEDSAKYSTAGTKGDQSDYVVLMDDSNSNVHGFFFRDSVGVPGKLIVQRGVEKLGDKVKTFFEESNFTSKVPLAAWSEGKYEVKLQGVPDHEIQTLQYTLYLDDGVSLSPADVRDALAQYLSNNSSLKSSAASAACTGSIRVYINRANYDVDTIYSIGVACSNDVTSSSAAGIQMEDIISGTMAAPDSYNPFKLFVCQTETVGESTGMVDFIWDVDNSGSMIDEQEAVAQTANAFIQQLTSKGIDFHLGVATTDSYVLEEADAASNQGYKLSTYNGKAPYLFENGLRYYNNMSGLCVSTSDKIVKSCFEGSVKDDSACTRNNNSTTVKNKNICGYGMEDGFASARYVLENLAHPSISIIKSAVNMDKWETAGTGTTKEAICKTDNADVVENCMTTPNADACYDSLIAYYGTVSGTDQCKRSLEGIKLRDGALKYIIWVSDENSRQFKEDGITVYDPGNKTSNQTATAVNVCKTGYELKSDIDPITGTGTMDRGICVSGTLTSSAAPCQYACNAQMNSNDRLAPDEDGVAYLEINESTDLMSLATAQDGKHKADYDLLMYYMMQYLQYAGSGGMAAFAIVGDDNATGGKCAELNESTGSGADYGWDYITAARYLSTFASSADGKWVDADGNYTMTGKGGGFASICNTDYNNIVNNIMNDAVGRVSSHTLKGYPISSTIRVSVNAQNSTLIELKRGASNDGFSYDSSQNAIIFSTISKELSSDDYISIAYVIWSYNQG